MKNLNTQINNARGYFLFFVKSLVLFLLIVACSSATAQSELSPKGRIDTQKGLDEQEWNSERDLIFKNSGPLRDVIAGAVYISGEKICEVEVSTSYFQAADRAKVEAFIDHSQCGASNGKYTVSLKTQDASGEIHSTKYKEVWSRPNTEAITVNHSYQIGENMELLKVRIKLPSKDYCTCIDGE